MPLIATLLSIQHIIYVHFTKCWLIESHWNSWHIQMYTFLTHKRRSLSSDRNGATETSKIWLSCKYLKKKRLWFHTHTYIHLSFPFLKMHALKHLKIYTNIPNTQTHIHRHINTDKHTHIHMYAHTQWIWTGVVLVNYNYN